MKLNLESEQVLAPQQAGFREHHCTEDQTTYLAQAIEDGFQQNKQTLAIWIDLQKAFHKVWTQLDCFSNSNDVESERTCTNV